MGRTVGSLLRVASLALLGTLVACSGRPAPAPPAPADVLGDNVVTVASFDFAESELLARLYGTALQRHGYTVRYELRLGPRELVQPALAAGLVELVPEYAGTALRFLSLDEQPGAQTPAAVHRSLGRQASAHGITVLAPAAAEDANAFVVTDETARRHGLRAISDLVPVAGELTFGGPPECPSRPLCLRGLEQVYGLDFAEFLSLDAGGPLTLSALQEAYVDVALLFSTDPALVGPGLVALEDDAGLQPPENVTPLLRREVVERFGPDLVAVLDAVSGALDTEALRQLNASVSSGADARQVARAWLTERGLA